MSNNKQSSVEWFISHLTKYGINLKLHKKEIEQAKAMHKEEIVNFTSNWYHNGLLGGEITVSESIKEHYTKTFKDNHEQD